MKEIMITLRNAEKVFPDIYTKVRLEDLANKSIEFARYLTQKEQEKLQNIAHEGFYSKGREHFEFIAKRIGKKIKLIPLD